MAPRYIRDDWNGKPSIGLKKGDYVLATKYSDGDPGDHFVVGFYDSILPKVGGDRHMVVDSEGKQFRGNGFRRVAKISARRGEWIIRHLKLIEDARDRFSVWHWFRAPWTELNSH